MKGNKFGWFLCLMALLVGCGKNAFLDIAQGMSMSEVRERLGTPYRRVLTVPEDAPAKEIWTYKRVTAGAAFYYIEFRAGVVSGVDYDD